MPPHNRTTQLLAARTATATISLSCKVAGRHGARGLGPATTLRSANPKVSAVQELTSIISRIFAKLCLLAAAVAVASHRPRRPPVLQVPTEFRPIPPIAF